MCAGSMPGESLQTVLGSRQARVGLELGAVSVAEQWKPGCEGKLDKHISTNQRKRSPGSRWQKSKFGSIRGLIGYPE